jgi:hypothetical protein
LPVPISWSRSRPWPLSVRDVVLDGSPGHCSQQRQNAGTGRGGCLQAALLNEACPNR